MKTPKITAEMLRRHKACPEQVKIFKQEWPNGAALTMENLHRAIVLGLSVYWSRGLLTGKALNRYERTQQRAWAELMVRQWEGAEYERVRDQAFLRALRAQLKEQSK